MFILPKRLLSAVLSALGALSVLATMAHADSLTYLAHAPTQVSAHPPLIVLLHGSGADERDMITMWRDLPPSFVVVSPRAPFPHGGGYVWYRKNGSQPRAADLAMSAKIVDLIVEEAAKRFDADKSRLFIGGFSQGAVMTYQIALKEPDRFRGAAVLSGTLFSSPTPSADMSHTAFFIGHGTADRRIPLAAATSARATLERLGAPVAFHAYAGMGHETGTAEMRDLRDWLDERAIVGRNTITH